MKWKSIEVVITSRTRNAVYRKVPWVRIPPLPPHLQRKPLRRNGFLCTFLEILYKSKYHIKRGVQKALILTDTSTRRIHSYFLNHSHSCRYSFVLSSISSNNIFASVKLTFAMRGSLINALNARGLSLSRPALTTHS